MPRLYLNGGIKVLDDIGAEVNVLYVLYALAFITVFLWILISFSKSKGLVNHHNAVALRSLVNFLRTADNDKKQTGELFEAITKNRNDVSMLFYMYCSIHSNFGHIEHYLNYRAYKHINKKRKPWGFTSVVIFAILITLAFSISYFVGLQRLLDKEMNNVDLLISIAFPLGLFLVWLMFRVIILMKYKMYWVEFENKFRKVNAMCKSFFKTQEEYYEEFADNILSKLTPYGGTKRRIERVIAMTDPDDIESQQPYIMRQKVKRVKDINDDHAPDQSFNQKGSDNGQQGIMSMMPRGAQVLKPHPETEAYLQAHTQITNQLMQMMMQQSMQQSQVIQRALTSQQALANTVAQQNIMAMRLEAQQASILRPDIAKRLADQTYAAWPSGRDLRPEMDEPKPQPEVKQKVTEVKETVVEVQPEPVPEEPTKTEEQTKAKSGFDISKLTGAFAMLSPPQSMNREPDPVFAEPEREPTHVEKRLGEFFTAKIYIYDEISEGEMI